MIIHTCLIFAVPGPVIGLTFTKISATILQISWTEPEVTNGVIQVYSLQVENFIDTSTAFQATVPGSQKSVLVTDLSKCILYTIHLSYIYTMFSSCFCRQVYSIQCFDNG